MTCSSDRLMPHFKLWGLYPVMSLYSQWATVQDCLVEKVKRAALTRINKGFKTTVSQHVGRGIGFRKRLLTHSVSDVEKNSTRRRLNIVVERLAQIVYHLTRSHLIITCRHPEHDDITQIEELLGL